MTVLSLLLAAAIGWQLVRLAWPPERRLDQRALRSLLGFVFGAGVVSLLHFALLLSGCQPRLLWTAFGEALLLATLACSGRRPHPRAASPEPAHGGDRWGRLLAGVFAIALAAEVLAFVLDTLLHPHGVSDALAIWNLRARLLFEAGTAWRDSFAPAWSVHGTDYPLLLPALVARTWSWRGVADTMAAATIAFGFCFACVGILWTGLRTLHSTRAACLGGGVLVALPLAAAGSPQHADLPLACWFLVTLLLLALHGHWQQRDHRLVALAGLAMGCAAWTKNEGLLFCLLLPAARAHALRQYGWRAVAHDLLALAAGAALPLAALAVFKSTIATPNLLLGQVATTGPTERLFAADRHLAIVAAGGSALRAVGLPVLAVVLAWACVQRRGRLALPLHVAALMFVGYYLAYLLASPELVWQLETSLPRLLMQLLPCVLLGVFSGGRPVVSAHE